MTFVRSSGVLLHPTSLPSPHGIGDLGQSAFAFIHVLEETKQHLWQVLPLGPTGYGDSPYQCFSAFAGNPLLISLEKLAEQGLLTVSDIEVTEPFDPLRVDYGPVIAYKTAKLRQAHQNFRAHNHGDEDFQQFVAEQASWLEDYALFMALKAHHGGGPWTGWPLPLVQREPEALQTAREQLATDIDYHRFVQWIFFRQWEEVHQVANRRGIQIIGDIPIFVAHDSADVWANPHLFYLEPDGQPTVVAGVPPDYFSATGQRWGNPLYRWELMEENGFRWWINRISATLKMVDIVRIDHFRGFEAYWEIPASEPTAVVGQWVKAPGHALFKAVREALGDLPLIAENLGVITPEVEALRKAYNLPGMIIVQFAFGDDHTNPFLPHNYEPDNVVYTGTHDNETTVGWFTRTDTTGTTGDPADLLRERNYARQYAKILDDAEVHWDLIRLAWGSVAQMAVVPLQDLLGLDNSARMNFPSSESGNWQWRFTWPQITYEMKNRLRELTEIYGRVVNNHNNNNNHS
jgi:4-alpha-glucanotransferase